MNKIYLYKLTTDNGGAPCVDRNKLSLAICKPRIRSTASPGCTIFGFGGKRLEERLIYIAVVTEKLARGDYYRAPRYEARPDCIYSFDDNGQAYAKNNRRYHKGNKEIVRDLGAAPDYRDSNVLISSDFKYFGGTVSGAEYREEFGIVCATITNLKQGHRVNHPQELREELLVLKKRVWNANPDKMKLGDPSDADHSKSCSEDDVFVEC